MPAPKFTFTRQDYDKERNIINWNPALADLMSMVVEPATTLVQNPKLKAKVEDHNGKLKIGGAAPPVRGSLGFHLKDKLGKSLQEINKNYMDFLSFFEQIERIAAILKGYQNHLAADFCTTNTTCNFYREGKKIFYKVRLDKYPVQRDANAQECNFLRGIEIVYELQGDDQYVFQYIGSESQATLDIFLRRTEARDIYSFLWIDLNKPDGLSAADFISEFKELLNGSNGLEHALGILLFAFQQPLGRNGRIDEQELMKAIDVKMKQQKVQIPRATPHKVDGDEEKSDVQKPQRTALSGSRLLKIFDGFLDYQRNYPGSAYTIDNCAQYLVMVANTAKSLGISEESIGKILLDCLVYQPRREGDLCYFLQNAEVGPIVKDGLTAEYLGQAEQDCDQTKITPLALIILQIELQRAEEVFVVAQLADVVSRFADASTVHTVNYFCTKYPNGITPQVLESALQRSVDKDGNVRKILGTIVCTIMSQEGGAEKISSILLSGVPADEKAEANDQKINTEKLTRILDVVGESAKYRDQIIEHLAMKVNLSKAINPELTKIREQLDNNRQLKNQEFDLKYFLKMGEGLAQYQVLASKLEDVFCKAYTNILLFEHYLQRIQFDVPDDNLDETSLDSAINALRQLQVIVVSEECKNIPSEKRLFLRKRLEIVSKPLFAAMQKERRNDISLYQKMIQKALVLLSQEAAKAKLDDVESSVDSVGVDSIRRDSRAAAGGAATKVGIWGSFQKLVGIPPKPKAAAEKSAEDQKIKAIFYNEQPPRS